MNTSNSTDQDHNRNDNSDNEAVQPTYAHIDVGCPICGNTKFSSTEENIPHGFDSHYVHVTCANCKTVLTIEYRAIDLFWYDGQDGQHSAVSQDLITPTETEYAEPSMYPPFPPQSVLRELDWPLACSECDERITANDILMDPDEVSTHDNGIADSEQIVFQCPNCEHVTTKALE